MGLQKATGPQGLNEFVYVYVYVDVDVDVDVYVHTYFVGILVEYGICPQFSLSFGPPGRDHI